MRLRRLLKSGLAHGMRWSGASLVKRTLDGWSGTPWIVAYHRVVEDFDEAAADSIPATLISRPMLERHLDWIGRRFEFVSLDDIDDRLRRGARFRRPAVAVTFDDGYADVYEQAFSLLQSRGIPAALFVVSDLIGTQAPPLFDVLHLLLRRAWARWPSPGTELARRIAEAGLEVPWSGAAGAPPDPLRATRVLLEQWNAAGLAQLAEALRGAVGWDEEIATRHRPLSAEMLRTLSAAGMTIGSHSRSHALLTQEDSRTVVEEAAGSRRALEALLGTPVRHFAYPNGWFDGISVAAVQAAGYRCAYTSCGHRDPYRPWLTLPRTLLWENSGLDASGRFSPAVMGCQADGTFPRLAGCPLAHPL